MMNNPFILQQAELWAKNILAGRQATPRERVAGMYIAALGRPPSVTEQTDAIAFLAEQMRIHGQPDDPRAWTDLAHVLFNLKEFVFVN